MGVACTLGDSSHFGLLGGAKFTKMGHSLPWMSMNCRAKFGAASFILVREIRNRTNTHTHKNKQKMIYPYRAYLHVWNVDNINRL